MTIECSTSGEFYNAIAALVIRGLTFTANATALTITLTGGY